MKVLVVGSGGREHALAWKIAQSKVVDKIFAAPGNGGISKQAECINISATDIPGLLDFARKENIDLTVVGPELPLACGIVDEFSKHKLRIFGPAQKAAQLESSKVFAKELLSKYRVPTANFRVFDNPQGANRYIQQRPMPCVVKADGLAAGKGVMICQTSEEAEKAINTIMKERIFAEAGERVIIEDCLEGQEASVIVFTDSQDVIPLASSQDHKRIDDFDQGANTGGMGAYSPAPVVTDDLNEEILRTIVYPTIKGLAAEGLIYKGILYVGIMITSDGPKVLEFNVRLGDPETQAILPRLNSDLVELMLATIEGRLSQYKSGLNWDTRSCVCVVCTSGGYPDRYERGKSISGLEEAEKLSDVIVFHAGTKLLIANGKSHIVTNGGRVLGVTGLGSTIKQAIRQTYQGVKAINFEGMHYRKDIGRRAL